MLIVAEIAGVRRERLIEAADAIALWAMDNFGDMSPAEDEADHGKGHRLHAKADATHALAHAHHARAHHALHPALCADHAIAASLLAHPEGRQKGLDIGCQVTADIVRDVVPFRDVVR